MGKGKWQVEQMVQLPYQHWHLRVSWSDLRRVSLKVAEDACLQNSLADA